MDGLPGPRVAVAVEAMATRFELAIFGDDPVRLRAAGEEALREIARLDARLSFYKSDSEISWINARAAREAKIDRKYLYMLIDKHSIKLGED